MTLDRHISFHICLVAEQISLTTLIMSRVPLVSVGPLVPWDLREPLVNLEPPELLVHQDLRYILHLIKCHSTTSYIMVDV